MPNARGHLIGGAVFYAAAGAVPLTKKFLPFASGPASILIGLLFCLFGALFPDIDTHSEGRKLLNLMTLVGIAMACHYKRYVAALLLAPLPLFAKLASHRGITHNPLFVTVVPAMFIYTIRPYAPWIPDINSKYYAAFIVGAISHIALDLTQTALKRKGFLKSEKAKRKGLRRSWW